MQKKENPSDDDSKILNNLEKNENFSKNNNVREPKELLSKKFKKLNSRKRFSSSRTNLLWGNISGYISSYDNEMIENYLKNPYANAKRLRNISKALYFKSPSYLNTVNHFAYLLTFDYFLYPSTNGTVSKNGIDNFYKAAKFVGGIDVKSTFPTMLLKTMINGTCYWYETSKEGAVFFDEIEADYCKVFCKDNENLLRYVVDLSLVPEQSLSEFPSEIQVAWKDWHNGKDKRRERNVTVDGKTTTIPGNFYLVSDKGFALSCHKESKTNDYPMLAPLFVDINTYDENKGYLNEALKDEAIKVTHFKVPTNNDNEMVLEVEDVEYYQDEADSRFPPTHMTLFTPFDVDTINADQSQKSQINLVDHSRKIVQNSSGISETIFSASTTNGLSYSIQNDANKIFPLLSYFNDYVNKKIKEYGYRINFLRITHHNRKDWHKQYASDLANGGSRFLFLSTCDLEPFQAIKMLELEKSLKIDDLLKPKMNANQMSAEVGAPELAAEEKKESTETGDKYK